MFDSESRPNAPCPAGKGYAVSLVSKCVQVLAYSPLPDDLVPSASDLGKLLSVAAFVVLLRLKLQPYLSWADSRSRGSRRLDGHAGIGESLECSSALRLWRFSEPTSAREEQPPIPSI